MWLVGYDPSDVHLIRLQDLRYWPLRHGSPFLDRPAVWVPASAIPALSPCSEHADLYIAKVQDDRAPRQNVFLLPEDMPAEAYEDALHSIRRENIALTVEFTYHQDWSTNTLQRIRILYDSVSLGLPTVYALPSSGVALRGTERRGDRNAVQRKIQMALAPECERLVRENKPVTWEKLQKQLRALGIDEPTHTENVADPKVHLFCRTMQDSYDVPCCTVRIDQVVSFAPNEWKVSGSQLSAVFNIMQACMDYFEANEKPAGVQSGVFTQSNDLDEDTILEGWRRAGHRNRNDTWDRYHEVHGFPNGCLAVMSTRPNRNSATHNFSLHIPDLADLSIRNFGESDPALFSRWIKPLRKRYHRVRPSPLRLKRIPPALLKRPVIITYRVASYARGREGAERWQNVNERTYASKLVLVDVCDARESRKIPGRPRAMSTSPTGRRYVLAAGLPMPSSELFSHYEDNARYRTWVDFADILICADGIFLGKSWWQNSRPVRIG